MSMLPMNLKKRNLLIIKEGILRLIRTADSVGNGVAFGGCRN
ncbi:MAG: hypothetical protein BWX48_02811 [Verrucomicrobia bacterium ADurb.Bin006]|nr:MAG: hypothetical protein BWX48_02811 [Verrucomicrobia bacterium ADurb.Bin006]